MTREEAITRLHWLKRELIKGTDMNEPIDMAIEALQADVARWSSWNKTFEQSGIADLISRADVHKTLNLLATEGGADAKMLLMDAHEFIDALPSAEAVPQSEQYKKGFEDAKRAYLVEYARESRNMRKRQLEVMLNAQKAISADAVQGEWEHWGSPFSDESEVIDTIVCSVCGARFIEPKDEPKGEYNYCPNCGARMKGGAE